MTNKNNNKKELVQVYERSFKQAIENAVKQNHLSDNDKYKEIAYQYGVIIATITDKNQDLTLKDLLPITRPFKEYQQNYLGE